MDPLIIIMARAGSKRIPGKNFKKLNGKLLIDYTIEAAIKSNISEHIWVSTDKLFEDDYYYDFHNGHKGKIYWHYREKDIDDKTTVQQALINILKGICFHHKPYFQDVIMLLPTNPFRTAKTLNDIYITYQLQQYKTLVSTHKIIENYHWTIPLDPDKLKRSQDLGSEYCLNGAIWISNINTLLQNNTFYHDETYYKPISFIEGFDIDTQEDWDISEIIARGMEERK